MPYPYPELVDGGGGSVWANAWLKAPNANTAIPTIPTTTINFFMPLLLQYLLAIYFTYLGKGYLTGVKIL
jgi:hypothetical protein